MNKEGEPSGWLMHGNLYYYIIKVSLACDTIVDFLALHSQRTHLLCDCLLWLRIFSICVLSYVSTYLQIMLMPQDGRSINCLALLFALFALGDITGVVGFDCR